MNLALPNVMRVLRTRYDMIACLTLNAAKPLITASLCEHHNLATPIITCRQAIIVKRDLLALFSHGVVYHSCFLYSVGVKPKRFLKQSEK